MTHPSLKEQIEERIKIASTGTKSDDEVVQIAWLADGIDLWHRSNHKMGHSPAQARRYIISSISRLIEDKQREAPERTWWVTDHDNNRKVAGPFTTDTDAALCREQLEKRENHHNYWLEQLNPSLDREEQDK